MSVNGNPWLRPTDGAGVANAAPACRVGASWWVELSAPFRQDRDEGAAPVQYGGLGRQPLIWVDAGRCCRHRGGAT